MRVDPASAAPIGSDEAPRPLRLRRDTVARVREKESTKLPIPFAGLEQADALLLAVSGGPDSMALLLMAANWARDLGSAVPAIHVATVDHGLRAASRSEAEMVSAAAAARGLPHTILDWTGPKPSTRLQERARAARYTLLGAHARAIGASHILTAHHADDQAETVLLRLGRGSGISGLAGMRRTVPLEPGLWLVRPLLDWTKAELVALCRAEGCAFIEDPSNHDPAFARSRLRAAAPVLAALGLDTPGMLRLARRMARADAALETETERVEASLPRDCGDGVVEVDLSASRDLSPEIRLRLTHRAIAQVARPGPVRLDRLEALTERLWAALGDGRGLRATLAGTRVALNRDGWLEVRAEGERRRGRPD